MRRASSTGVRSAPPPNQALVVTTKRVFMCTAGTCGFCGCAISEMPEAQNRGSASAPGISLRNSGANSPCTVEAVHADFLEHAAAHHRHHAAAAGRAAVVGALPGRAHEAAGGAVGERRAGGQRVLDRLERGADVVAQALEPGPRPRLAGFQVQPASIVAL